MNGHVKYSYHYHNGIITVLTVNYNQGGNELDHHTLSVLQQSNHYIDGIDTRILMKTIKMVFSVGPTGWNNPTRDIF